MPQNGSTATQAQSIFLKEKKKTGKNVLGDILFLFELKYIQKGSSSPINSRK